MAATEGDNGPPLKPVEQLLIDHIERGELLDLAGDEPVDEAAMRSWDESRTVSATVIRDIVRGRLAPDIDPHGLRLRGARISGRVDLENIHSSTLWIELSDCLLEEGLIARDTKVAGLELTGCRLEHPTEPALNAVRLTATVLSLGDLTATAHTTRGTITVVHAHLGQFSCSAAHLCNDSGPALNAEGLHVDQNVFLRDGFDAVGTGEPGAVRLSGAHVGGHLDCSGAHLCNDSGPALNAEGLHVNHMFLGGGFDAVGTGEPGAVRLSGAHVGGYLDCSGAHLCNDSGPALIADGLHVNHMFLRGGFDAVSGGTDVVVVLNSARVGGVLVFQPARLEHRSDPQMRLSVDGLTYTGLASADWLTLVRTGTPAYAAQPYQQLAAVHRSAGHDGQARDVLRKQRYDQIHRKALTGRAERTWARFTGLTLGYGYQPWRAVIGLLAVAIAAVALAGLLGSHSGLAQVRNPPAPTPQPCSMIDQIGVGLDLGTPLITTGARTRCDTTATTNGQILTITGWALRLLAWAFATLFIAGFTGAVRKT